MALGLTQPLPELSTRNISCGLSWPVPRTDNLTIFMCRLSSNMGASASWNPQGLSGMHRIAVPHISPAAQPLLATPLAVLFSDNTDVTVQLLSFFLLCFSFAFRVLTCADITARLHAVLFQCKKKSLMSVRHSACKAQPSKRHRSCELRTLFLIFINFLWGQVPLLGLRLPIIDASRLHPDVPWTSDQPDADIST